MRQSDLIDALARQLAARDDVILAIAFGSIVSGMLRPDSDVDIAVLTDPPLTVERNLALISELAATAGRPIDLVDLKTAGVPVTREVLARGRRLVCRDEGALADVLSRMLIDAADFLPLRQRILRERREAWIG
jgi:predicted nucleotidyltransferase